MTPFQQMYLGLGAKKKVYVEDVYHTHAYTGHSSSSPKDITGAAFKPDMIWIKNRQTSDPHVIIDSVRGANKYLRTDNDWTSTTNEDIVNNFLDTGFRVGNNGGFSNAANEEHVGMTFKKQEGFFDIQTWTGSGVTRTISHDLNSVPGLIIVKKISTSGADWLVYHVSMGNEGQLKMNSVSAKSTGQNIWNSTTPTSTHFSIVGSNGNVNANGTDYIAYIFANDAQIFGEEGNQSIIKCGTYSGSGSAVNVNVGWEPQLVLIKVHNADDNWYLANSICGMDWGDGTMRLNPDTTGSETPRASNIQPTATGFRIGVTGDTQINNNGKEYVYVAIRRPDPLCGKPAEAGTDVFAMDTGAGTSNIPNFDSGFPVDFALYRHPSTANDWTVATRLNGGKRLYTNQNNSETTVAGHKFDSQVGWNEEAGGSSYQSWMWRRHKGLDVSCYIGNASSGKTVSHSLGRVPEMIWIKSRNTTDNWAVGHKGLNGGTNPWEYALKLNATEIQDDTSSRWNDTAPTSTHFTLGNAGPVNDNNQPYLAILFSSVVGISKCGFYTGNGSTGQTITLGFQPRFLILKNIDTASAWEVLDTTRGWGSGNDNHIALDSTSAQSGDDFGAPTSTGFTLVNNYTSNNKDGDNFIYYAHA